MQQRFFSYHCLSYRLFVSLFVVSFVRITLRRIVCSYHCSSYRLFVSLFVVSFVRITVRRIVCSYHCSSYRQDTNYLT